MQEVLGLRYFLSFVDSRSFALSGGAVAYAPIFDHGQFSALVPTGVELTIIAASVPEPWEVIWIVNSPGTGLSDRQFTGNSDLTGPPVTINLSAGARVSVSVTHRPNFAIIGPSYPITLATGELIFNIITQPLLADLHPPITLSQSLPVGGILRLTFNRTTGVLTTPPLTLRATTGAINRFTLPVGIDFSVYTSLPTISQVASKRFADRRQRTIRS